MTKSNDKRLNISRQMPPLRKKQRNKEYDIQKDEVLKWVMGQPELVNVLVDFLKNWGYITYDKEAGTWQGVDYNGD